MRSLERFSSLTDDLVNVWLENVFNLLIILVSNHIDVQIPCPSVSRMGRASQTSHLPYVHIP